MRQDLVHRWRQAMRDGLTTTDAARAVHGPRATLYRWEQSPDLLSRRPHRCRQGPPRAAIRQRITELRQDCPAWGRGKIAAILRRDGHPISTATVGRVIADRVARQPIAPVSAFTHDSKTKRRTRRPDAVRISGALKAQAPGDAVQVGTLTAALCPGRTVQHVTALDRHSQWGSARAAGQAKGITLAVRPPKGAKMNGAACRMQATWRPEFDNVQDTATQITELNPLIDTHLDLDNGWRPHDARDDQTPNEYLESLRIAANP